MVFGIYLHFLAFFYFPQLPSQTFVKVHHHPPWVLANQGAFSCLNSAPPPAQFSYYWNPFLSCVLSNLFSCNYLPYSHFSHCVFKLFSSAFEHILVSLTKINKTENKSIYTFPYTPYLPGTVLLFYFPHTQKSLKQCILFLSFCTCAPSTYSHLTARKGNSPRYWQPTTLLLSPVFNSPQHDISWAFPFWNIFFP